MAERRMIAKTIVDSDAFCDMSVEARLLYYDLNMRADDDGVVNSARKIMRMIGVDQKALEELTEKRFILSFEDKGVVVIKHWKVNNYIRKDTYTPSKYRDVMERLEEDGIGAYRLRDESVTSPSRVRDEPSTQDRIGKDRLGKYIPPTTEEIDRGVQGGKKEPLSTDAADFLREIQAKRAAYMAEKRRQA